MMAPILQLLVKLDITAHAILSLAASKHNETMPTGFADVEPDLPVLVWPL